MNDALAELAKQSREREKDRDEWDYSVRAKEYAQWLDQTYLELVDLRSRYLEKIQK